ncbi:hypothetical protein BV898_08064 [Hypsibius exemplaris]|uniref:G-protein coupled receptors family 1 profile domain-containing protein n=1 Tax=Hypsibius exemplaris TaxID=2072580 RepID=A0A1W0WRY5_HYPEX|nr:hypothetical protein BV898_08064 [Hypsibius exemplaris]
MNASIPHSSSNLSDPVYPNSSSIFAFLWHGHEMELYRWLIVSGIVCGLGVLLNATVLVALITLERVAHSSCRLQIAHLLAIDLLQCTTAGPLALINTPRPRVNTLLECFLLRVPFMLVECAANWCACFLALNRFVAIVFPLKYRRLSRRPVLDVASIALPWLAGVLLTLPYMTGYGGVWVTRPPMFRCLLLESPHYSSNNILFLGFVLPMALLMVFYVSAAGKMVLRRSEARRRREQIHHHHQAIALGGAVAVTAAANPAVMRGNERRYALAKMLFLAALLYTMLYLPNPVITFHFPRLVNDSLIYRLWLRTVYNAGLLVNPIVFVTMSLEYRMELLRLFRNFADRFYRVLCGPPSVGPSLN